MSNLMKRHRELKLAYYQGMVKVNEDGIDRSVDGLLEGLKQLKRNQETLEEMIELDVKDGSIECCRRLIEGDEKTILEKMNDLKDYLLIRDELKNDMNKLNIENRE